MKNKCIAKTKSGGQCSRNVKRLDRCEQHAKIQENEKTNQSSGTFENKDGVYKEYMYNSMYLIYNDGRIYSKNVNRFVKPSNSNGYLAISIVSKEKGKITRRIHRLIALHFVENANPTIFNVVDHIDGNKNNNHYLNLRWTSHKGNKINAIKNGVKSGNTKKIKIYDDNKILIGTYDSFAEASRKIAISTRTIYKSVKNQCVVSSIKGLRYYCECENYTNKIDPPEDGRQIPNFSDNYIVTPNGQIWSKFKMGFLNLETNKDGYKRVGLKHKKRKEKFSVHRLVAKLFIPNNDTKKIQVNHRDGDKSNNNVSNLEWTTPSENSLHKINLHSKLCRPVLQLDPETSEVIKRHNSINDAAKETGMHFTSIGNCVRGLRKTSAGFKWCYENEEI